MSAVNRAVTMLSRRGRLLAASEVVVERFCVQVTCVHSASRHRGEQRPCSGVVVVSFAGRCTAVGADKTLFGVAKRTHSLDVYRACLASVVCNVAPQPRRSPAS